MTRQQILSLTAGAQLDGIVAQELMNYPACLGRGYEGKFTVVNNEPIWLVGPHKNPITCPRYSLDIKAAWQVLEVMQARCIFIGIHPTADGFNVGDMLNGRHLVQDESFAPAAICLSALLAHFELPGYEAEANQMWKDALAEQAQDRL
jgi:hypothetical protein